MSYEIYKYLHLSSVVLFFLLSGASFFLPRKSNKVVPILFSLVAILLLVTGMGLLARLSLGFPPWILAKIALWFLAILLIPILKKRLERPEKTGVIAMAVIGLLIVYLVSFRPFS